MILDEPPKPSGEHMDAGEGETRLNFGEHKAAEAFCFLQIMKLVLGLVSQVKGRRNAFLSENERREHFLFFPEANARYLGWSTWALWCCIKEAK